VGSGVDACRSAGESVTHYFIQCFYRAGSKLKTVILKDCHQVSCLASSLDELGIIIIHVLVKTDWNLASCA